MSTPSATRTNGKAKLRPVTPKAVPAEVAPPPHDIDAERIVIVALLDQQPDAVATARAIVSAEDFYDRDYSRLFRAALAVGDLGVAPAPEQLAVVLAENGEPLDARALESLRDLRDLNPANVLWQRAAERVRDLASKRRELCAAQELAAAIRVGDDERAEQARVSLSGARETRNTKLVRFNASGIFAELGPIAWVCDALELAPGAPSMLAGYGYSGKTVLAQDLALAVASRGEKAWGAFTVRHGRVCHLDYEQGAYLTRRRYQRLAAARDLGPADLDLELIVRPPVYLDDDGAEDWLCSLLDGAVLAVIDPLRAAAPRTEENASEARVPLDLLARVSERTDCAILVLHHARKPSENATGGARMSIRGSSALYDACQSVAVADGAPGQPVHVTTRTKAKLTGREQEELEVTIEDVEIDGHARAGLRVAADGATKRSRPRTASAEARAKILAVIDAHPTGASKRRVRHESNLGSTTVDDVLELLVEDGELGVTPGERGATLYTRKAAP